MSHHRTAYQPAGPILVLGGGMAGLAAALRAAQAGARVILVEADTVPGGSARWSSGRIWSLADYDALRAAAPLGEAPLQRVLADELELALDWLGRQVGHLSAQPPAKAGRGCAMQLGVTGDRSAYFAAFAEAAKLAGVELYLETRALDAARLPDGSFQVTCETQGARSVITATALVVATGGFQGDRGLLMKYMGPEAGRLMLRSNPNSSGTGLRIGEALGGSTSRGMAQFYGKSMPPGAPSADPRTYKSLTYDVARAAVAVNIEGHRFVDETSGISSETVAHAGMMQPGEHYALLLDGRQQGDFDLAGVSQHATKTGQQLADLVLTADTLDDLFAAMAGRWGFSAAQLRRTFADFNAAAVRGATHAMSPPRRGEHAGLLSAPFTALRCKAAITIPLGGLKVDAAMQLCDTDLQPISGIFVAGADAGGVYPGAYAGGLAWALVSGCVAGVSAAQAMVAPAVAAQ